MKKLWVLGGALLLAPMCVAQTPVITTATGTTTTYGQTFLVDVQGTNISTGATLLVNGTAVTTYSPASGELQTLYKNTTGTSTSVSVVVQNPSPGGVSSSQMVNLTIPAPPVNEEDWLTQVGQQNNSPIFPATSDIHVLWVNPDSRGVNLWVKSPAPAAGASTVTINTTGTGDAQTEFRTKIGTAISTHAGLIKVTKGTYTFTTLGPTGAAHLELTGLSDVMIDGQGSTLVFTQLKDGIRIAKSQRLRMVNFNIKYVLPTQNYFVGTVSVNASTGLNELYAASGYALSSADTVGHMMQYDVVNSAFVQGGPKLDGASLTWNASSGGFAGSQLQSSTYAGKTFLVWEKTYAANAIGVYDQVSSTQDEDIILSYINIYSAPGMGIFTYGLVRGLEVGYVNIVPEAGSLTSVSNDGIHIGQAGGDVYIHNTVIANHGDDGVNFNNSVMPVTAGCSTTCTLGKGSRFVQKYDLIAFFDVNDNFVGSAYAASNPNFTQISNTISLSVAPPSTAAWARDMNTVNQRVAFISNTVRDCSCHGVLIQTPNARLQSNTFSNTTQNAVRMLTNTANNFQEGTGAINVGLQNNTINNSGTDPLTFSGMFWSAISLYGPVSPTSSTSTLTAVPVNKWVNITGNTVNTAMQGCITVSSAETVNVKNNTCNNTNTVPLHGVPSIDVFKANTVTIQGNTRTLGAAGRTGGINVDSATTFAITDLDTPTY